MFYRGITPEFLLGHGINPDGLLFGPRFLPYNPNLKQFSRDLRKGYQLAEVKLWKCLRAKNMGYAFRRQYPILNYIADFYCNQLNLVIEIDGMQHGEHDARLHDHARTCCLNELGLSVIRFTNRDIEEYFESVCHFINQTIDDRTK